MGMRGGNREEGSDKGAQKRHFGGGWNKHCTFYLWLDHSLFLNVLCSQQNGKIQTYGRRHTTALDVDWWTETGLWYSGGCCLVSIQVTGGSECRHFRGGTVHTVPRGYRLGLASVWPFMLFPVNSWSPPEPEYAHGESCGNDSFRTLRYHLTNCSFSAI